MRDQLGEIFRPSNLFIRSDSNSRNDGFRICLPKTGPLSPSDAFNPEWSGVTTNSSKQPFSRCNSRIRLVLTSESMPGAQSGGKKGPNIERIITILSWSLFVLYPQHLDLLRELVGEALYHYITFHHDTSLAAH